MRVVEIKESGEKKNRLLLNYLYYFPTFTFSDKHTRKRHFISPAIYQIKMIISYLCSLTLCILFLITSLKSKINKKPEKSWEKRESLLNNIKFAIVHYFPFFFSLFPSRSLSLSHYSSAQFHISGFFF